LPNASRTVLTLLLLAPLFGACDLLSPAASPPKAGTWEPLRGVQGPQLFAFGFDGANHPLAGGDGGLKRYTEADGWVKVGTNDDTVQVLSIFPGNDGGVYTVDTANSLHHLALGAAQWTPYKDTTKGPEPYHVEYVGSDGTIYRRVTNVGIQIQGPNETTWKTVPGSIYPSLQDKAGNLYYFPQKQPIARQDVGQATSHTIVDCHTKALLQCGIPFYALRVTDQGMLYFVNPAPGTIEVFGVPTTGGTPKSLGGFPRDVDYTYYKSAWVTDDGTTYIAAAPSTDAYGWGDFWRFKPGDATGQMIFRAPRNQTADNSLPVAPESNLAVAPDGTMYTYLPVKGGVTRYKPAP
jgi:hypothetical protein